MPGQPADAPGAFIDQTAVALLHTAGAVAVRDVRNRVGLGENIHINRRVLRRPAPRLIAAGQDQEQPQERTGRAGPQNGLRGERVKACLLYTSGVWGEPPELKHLSRARKRHQMRFRK